VEAWNAAVDFIPSRIIFQDLAVLPGWPAEHYDLRGPDLSGLDLSAVILLRADLTGANLAGTKFANAYLRALRFRA
jgi:uncharacterized protein YjbI with pentapeptide repeats